MIKAVTTDLILSVSGSAFFSRIANVFDLSKWRKEREAKVRFCSEMHILSAHIAAQHIVLFGEPKVRDFHFHLELLARPDLNCIKESHGLTFEVKNTPNNWANLFCIKEFQSLKISSSGGHPEEHSKADRTLGRFIPGLHSLSFALVKFWSTLPTKKRLFEKHSRRVSWARKLL